RDPDTRPARHTREAWTPASAGATRFFVVPALSRDPDKAARHACEGLDSGLRRSDEDWDRIALNLAALKIPRRPGARPGSRHKTGAPGARSLDSGLRRSDEYLSPQSTQFRATKVGGLNFANHCVTLTRY